MVDGIWGRMQEQIRNRQLVEGRTLAGDLMVVVAKMGSAGELVIVPVYVA